MSHHQVPSSELDHVAARSTNAVGPNVDVWGAAAVWLKQLQHRVPPASPETIANYKREIARIRRYCVSTKRPTPERWTIDDATSYLQYLRTSNAAQPEIVDGEVVPPAYTRMPAPQTVANSQKVLHAFCAFLRATGFAPFNPMATMAPRRPRGPSTRQAIPLSVIDEVLRVMELQDRKTHTAGLLYARDRFLLRLFESAGVRTSEAAAADMSDVELISDPDLGRVYWSLVIKRGKGGQAGRVFLEPQVVTAFRDYRIAFGLPADVQLGEDYALVLSPRTKNPTGESIPDSRSRRFFRFWKPVRSRTAIYTIIKGRFSDAAEVLDMQGRNAESALLRRASTHSLRHTAATTIVMRTKNLALAKEQMRHADVNTTMSYTHSDFIEVARELANKTEY